LFVSFDVREEKLGGISLGVEQRFVSASFYVLWITPDGRACREMEVRLISVFPLPLDGCISIFPVDFDETLFSIASNVRFPS
jgi:hypothetical protein